MVTGAVTLLPPVSLLARFPFEALSERLAASEGGGDVEGHFPLANEGADAVEVSVLGVVDVTGLGGDAVEFENFEAALAHYNSDAYQLALAALGDGAVRDMRIVEGVE